MLGFVLSGRAGLWRDLPGMVPPFLRIIFYLEPFSAIFPLNPAESARIMIFESGNLGLLCGPNRRVWNGLSKRDSGLIMDDFSSLA